MPRFGSELRPSFVHQITEAAREHGIELRWCSDYWVARLGRDDVVEYVVGYTFPLNNAASANVANDKAATAVVLEESGAPVVGHELFRFKSIPEDEWVDTALATRALPLVVKPHTESGGIDVERAGTRSELHAILADLAKRHRAVTISPYLPLQEEYRIVVLDDRPRVAYRKVRQRTPSSGEAEWRHNLRLGARAEIIDPASIAPILDLARRVMRVLGLRFASVDIVVVDDEPMVLEVNSAVTLEHFSRQGNENFTIAASIYSEALRLCFEGSRCREDAHG